MLKLHDKISCSVAAISFISINLCLSFFTNNLQHISLNLNLESLKHKHNGTEQNSSCTLMPNTQTLETTVCCSLQSSLFKRYPRKSIFYQSPASISHGDIAFWWKKKKFCKLVLIIRPHACSPTLFPDSLQPVDCNLAHCSCFLKSLMLTTLPRKLSNFLGTQAVAFEDTVHVVSQQAMTEGTFKKKLRENKYKNVISILHAHSDI